MLFKILITIWIAIIRVASINIGRLLFNFQSAVHVKKANYPMPSKIDHSLLLDEAVATTITLAPCQVCSIVGSIRQYCRFGTLSSLLVRAYWYGAKDGTSMTNQDVSTCHTKRSHLLSLLWYNMTMHRAAIAQTQ